VLRVKRVLGIPAYRRLLFAYTMNDLAWSVGVLALSVLVYRRTGSAFGSAGFFLASQFGPALISPALVARVDQHAARVVLPVVYLLEGLLFLLLAYLAAHFSLAPVLIVVVIDGIAGTVARSLIKASTAAVLTPRGLLREGNALLNAEFSASYMIGPAIGGAVVVADGTQAAMLINAILFLLTSVDLATTVGLPRAVPDRLPTAGRLRSAIASVRRDKLITALLVTQGAAVVAFTIAVPVEVVFAQRTLHAGAGGYGAMLSAWGTGAVVSSLAYARWLNASARTLLAVSAGALGVGFVLMAAAPSIAVAIVAAVIAGSGNGVQVVAARTFVQERTSQNWMAIVMGLQESIVIAAPGVGILIGGSIAALVSPRAALGVAGVASLAITAMFWIVLRPAAAPPSSRLPGEPYDGATLRATQNGAEALHGAATREVPWSARGSEPRP
jgi:MFS family permease